MSKTATKNLITLLALLFGSFSTLQGFAGCNLFSDLLSCDCCPGPTYWCADIEAGWRSDALDWKISDLKASHVSAKVNDRIHFKDINSYTISGQLKCVSSSYYIKASADYGWTDKGRAHEHFNIESPYIYDSISVKTSNPIKRQSEVYDFSGAIGYPFAFFNCRLSIIPLIGFSYHRQHLRVKLPGDSSSCSSYNSYSYGSKNSSSDFPSSSFLVVNDSGFIGFPAFNPFSSSSDTTIANELGLFNPHRTDNYRFTWYGFYFGADMAFALNSSWTLYWDTEFHVFDNCHRKRKSWTGVHFVDDYHEKGSAYGFNNTVGVNVWLYSCWYGTLSVDFNWWKAHSKDDDLHWKKVGAKAGLAYLF